MPAEVDVDTLLDDCLRVVSVEVGRMRATQDAKKRLDTSELHALAKLVPVLQQVAMIRLDPFGDLAKARRALRDAKEISAAQKRLLGPTGQDPDARASDQDATEE